MCSEKWENTYLRLIRIVTNPKKFSKTLKKWKLQQDSRILDLCCGNGGSLEVFKKAGYRNLYGLDLSPNLLSRVKKGVPLILADANICPIQNNAFDVVIIHKALHHFLDHRLLLTEIKRILKPEGFFCFIEPRKTWFRKLYHLVLFSPFIEIFPPLLSMRNAALIEEGETYFSWLDNSHQFFHMLESGFAFATESRKDDLIHHIVKCRSIAKSEASLSSGCAAPAGN
ncbi:MAG: class I SAM-dependent methyltransferase [Pseudomonadota bacterium]